MATTILTLPLAQVEIITGTNEDWLSSLQYTTNDGIPINITGITFEMEVRLNAQASEVVVTASTNDGRITVGGIGESFMLISVPVDVMRSVPPGNYIADIVASADGFTRTTVQVTALTIYQGITRTPYAWEQQ